MSDGGKFFLTVALYCFLATGTTAHYNRSCGPELPGTCTSDGGVAGLCWPLYWTYKAWDKVLP